ncbi:MAG: hydrogenase/urease maturation nickel metallochaperone HypA [Dehalococcoidia bacterium]
MHEAGLAAAIAATVAEQGLAGRQLRLLVSGGHHARPEEFDAALLAHLGGAGMALDLQIVHMPMELACSVCAAGYTADTGDVECPGCGGAPLPAREESVELEVVDGKVS